MKTEVRRKLAVAMILFPHVLHMTQSGLETWSKIL